MTHITVIGAGITGVTIAYALSRRGYRVTVLDRQRYAAMETSFANGGQISACNGEVWNKLSTLIQGMRRMLRRDAPLLMAGTTEFNGVNRDIRHDRIQPLIDWTREQFPRVDTDRVAAWSGLRPMLPRTLPKVGRGRRPGVFYNTGHGHLGWTLSGATAELVVEAVGAEHPPKTRGLGQAA